MFNSPWARKGRTGQKGLHNKQDENIMQWTFAQKSRKPNNETFALCTNGPLIAGFNRGQAFVEYDTRSEAEQAIEHMHSVRLL